MMPSHLPLVALALALPLSAAQAAAPKTPQIPIRRVEQMPNIPHPYKMRDWRALAVAFDRFAFDTEAKGQFLPFLWWDDTHVNSAERAFGLPSYVGSPNSTGANHEGITCMGAVLGATIAGIDKTRGPHNWVRLCEAYYNTANGQRLVLNHTSAGTGGSFWYELWPHVLFYALADKYPRVGRLQDIARATAGRWHEACLRMGGDKGLPDFDHTAFNFKTMQPVDNGKWREPDAAAGIAWLTYMAWTRWKDPRHLQAARWGLQFLHNRHRTNGALYEVLLPFGALAAARMNAEQGTGYDVDKLLNGCFDGNNPCRWGWGIMADRWGEADCHGLQGSITHGKGGYAFAMSTFAFPAALVPLVRYDDRYARAIGKYVLNAANAARLFYPDEHPPAHQSSASWNGDPQHVVPYEALLADHKGIRPYATGDALKHKWGPKTDLGLYGGCLVGLFGGIIATTDVEAILRLDCLATDFFRAPAHPTYLYYNPHGETKQVSIDVGPKPATLYDAAANAPLATGVKGTTRFAIPADGAVLLVVVPAEAKLTHDGRKTLADGVVIEYNNGRAPLPPRAPNTRPPVQDKSIAVRAARATLTVDGDPADWAKLESDAIALDTGGRGTLRCTLRYAWDADHLYVLVTEQPGDTTRHEASKPAHFERSPWDFDGVMLFIEIENAATPSPHSSFNACFGFSSERRTDLLTARTNRPDKGWRPSCWAVPNCRVATRGSFAGKNRVIEAAIAWRDVAARCLYELPDRAPLLEAIRSGFRFGCEPLLVDDDWRKQAYIGGAQHQRPTGRDANSRDIVLIDSSRL